MKAPVNWGIAGRLIRFCAEVNARQGITLTVGSASLRVLPTAAAGFPPGSTDAEYVVVVAGSNDFPDWIKNFKIFLKAWPPFGSVHRGFLEDAQALMPELAKVLGGARRVLFTGHSRGGPITVLLALWWWNDMGREVSDVYTFASPRMGDAPFKSAVAACPFHVFRVIVGADGVPQLCGSECHPGAAYYLTARGEDREQQDLPAWWNVFRRIRLALDNHISDDEYLRAVERRALAYAADTSSPRL